MSIVSNASPLINLARIGELDLLSQLYGELIVPDAVPPRSPVREMNEIQGNKPYTHSTPSPSTSEKIQTRRRAR